jgi:hypothetical protein
MKMYAMFCPAWEKAYFPSDKKWLGSITKNELLQLNRGRLRIYENVIKTFGNALRACRKVLPSRGRDFHVATLITLA